jgi:hypothetical protein
MILGLSLRGLEPFRFYGRTFSRTVAAVGKLSRAFKTNYIKITVILSVMTRASD